MDKIDYRVHGRVLGVIWAYLWYMVEEKVFNEDNLMVKKRI